MSHVELGLSSSIEELMELLGYAMPIGITSEEISESLLNIGAIAHPVLSGKYNDEEQLREVYSALFDDIGVSKMRALRSNNVLDMHSILPGNMTFMTVASVLQFQESWSTDGRISDLKLISNLTYYIDNISTWCSIPIKPRQKFHETRVSIYGLQA